MAEHVRIRIDDKKVFKKLSEVHDGMIPNSFTTISRIDADAGKASDWLNALRRNSNPVAVPDGDSLTPAATAKLLGMA